MQTKDLNTALDWTGCAGVRLTGRVAEGGPHASRRHADGADLRLAHGWDGFWQLWHRRQIDSTITWLASGRTRGPRLRRVWGGHSRPPARPASIRPLSYNGKCFIKMLPFRCSCGPDGALRLFFASSFVALFLLSSSNVLSTILLHFYFEDQIKIHRFLDVEQMIWTVSDSKLHDNRSRR